MAFDDGVGSIDRRTLLAALGGGSIATTAGCLDNLGDVGGGGGEEFVTIGTGGTGGVYYALGGGIADLLNEDEELDVDASAEATGASVENAQLLGDGEIDMALILGNSALLAVEGEGDFGAGSPSPIPGGPASPRWDSRSSASSSPSSSSTGPNSSSRERRSPSRSAR
jgi:uncharacterized protein